jgi:hypothetical protein
MVSGPTDVTAAVTGAGYVHTPTHAPGAFDELFVRVRVKSSASPGEEFPLLIETSATTVERADTVLAVAKRKA